MSSKPNAPHEPDRNGAPAGRGRRFVVTGCAGFVGSHLTQALLDRGDEVLGIDAFTDYYARAVKEANLTLARARGRFSLIEANLAEMLLEPVIAGVDGIFHLAAQPGVRGSWGTPFAGYLRNNLLATQRILEAAAAANVRVVHASSSSVYGEVRQYPTRESTKPRPVSPYGVSKLACEHLGCAYAASRGLDIVTLRYFTVYGPRQRPDMAFARVVDALAKHQVFHVFGDGSQSRDFTFVSDAVSATVAAMDRAPSGAVYNVGGGDEASLRDVIQLCERLAERQLDVVYETAALGDVRRTAADTTRIRRELGWAPTTPLSDGLAAQLRGAGALALVR